MRRVILVRHGESLLNAMNEYQKILCGQFDTPLTDRGREQEQIEHQLLLPRRGVEVAVAGEMDRADHVRPARSTPQARRYLPDSL